MLDEKLEQYLEAFGESFPMIPLAWGRTEKETISLIDECIQLGKNAYERGLVEDSADIDY